MIIDIMQYCNNYFLKFKKTGTFDINDDSIIINEVVKGCDKCDYVIIKSNHEDGIYKILEVQFDEEKKKTTIQLEDFNSFATSDNGIVFFSLIPKRMKDLADKINEQVLNNDLMKPEKNIIISESLGNYSYTKRTNKDGSVLTWKDVYSAELKPYRKLFAGYGQVPEY